MKRLFGLLAQVSPLNASLRGGHKYMISSTGLARGVWTMAMAGSWDVRRERDNQIEQE